MKPGCLKHIFRPIKALIDIDRQVMMAVFGRTKICYNPSVVQNTMWKLVRGSMSKTLLIVLRVMLIGTAFVLAGCQSPNRIAKYPPGSLRVCYEEATSHSSCLVASVAMAANYVVGERRFSEGGIRADLKRAGLDESRVGDLKTYLADQGLHLVTLAGRLDGNPPLGVKYWLLSRGYPVICVINRDPVDPNFNHAVVLIGISTTDNIESTDRIHYLDPSSAAMMHTDEAAIFETAWARGQHAMMVVVVP